MPEGRPRLESQEARQCSVFVGEDRGQLSPENVVRGVAEGNQTQQQSLEGQSPGVPASAEARFARMMEGVWSGPAVAEATPWGRARSYVWAHGLSALDLYAENEWSARVYRGYAAWVTYDLERSVSTRPTNHYFALSGRNLAPEEFAPFREPYFGGDDHRSYWLGEPGAWELMLDPSAEIPLELSPTAIMEAYAERERREGYTEWFSSIKILLRARALFLHGSPVCENPRPDSEGSNGEVEIQRKKSRVDRYLPPIPSCLAEVLADHLCQRWVAEEADGHELARYEHWDIVEGLSAHPR